METRQRLLEANPEAVMFDGLDDALIGIGCQYSKRMLAIYSVSKIIEVLEQTMSYEDAVDWFDYNISSVWAGENTPILVYDEVEEDNG